MSLLWTTVSGLLAMELIIVLTLCAPLPWGVRKTISRWIFRMRVRAKLDTILRYVFFALALALVESINSLRTLHVRKEFQDNGGEVIKDQALAMAALQDFRWQKTRAERNLYLASFAITCIIVITRLVHLASIEVQLRNKIKDYNGNKPLTETGETILMKQD